LKPWFFFQASSFQLLKLENLLRWFFPFIYNCSSNMNYFIYTGTSHLNVCAVNIYMLLNVYIYMYSVHVNVHYLQTYCHHSFLLPDVHIYFV